MFKIAMRNGSPVNVGQMIELDRGTSLNPGDMTCIVNGEASYVGLGICPDAIVSQVNGDKVTAMLLTEDMIIEGPVLADDPELIKVGGFVGIEDSDKLNVNVGSDYIQIIDTLDFKKSGDHVLFRVIHSSERKV